MGWTEETKKGLRRRVNKLLRVAEFRGVSDVRLSEIIGVSPGAIARWRAQTRLPANAELVQMAIDELKAIPMPGEEPPSELSPGQPPPTDPPNPTSVINEGKALLEGVAILSRLAPGQRRRVAEYWARWVAEEGHS